MHEPGSGKGLLANFVPLTNYKSERQHGTFSAQDGCNFVCNIYEEGDVLSIVVDSGSHGTHVAGITAAHQPDNPSLNGIAPGSPLVLLACCTTATLTCCSLLVLLGGACQLPTAAVSNIRKSLILQFGDDRRVAEISCKRSKACDTTFAVFSPLTPTEHQQPSHVCMHVQVLRSSPARLETRGWVGWRPAQV